MADELDQQVNRLTPHNAVARCIWRDPRHGHGQLSMPCVAKGLPAGFHSSRLLLRL